MEARLHSPQVRQSVSSAWRCCTAVSAHRWCVAPCVSTEICQHGDEDSSRASIRLVISTPAADEDITEEEKEENRPSLSLKV